MSERRGVVVLSIPNFWVKRYRAPSVPGSLVAIFVVLSALMSLIQGTAYALKLSQPATKSVSSAFVGGSESWGFVLALSSLFFLTAVAARRHGIVWFGHVLLCATYAGFAFSLLQAATTGYFGGEGYEVFLAPVVGMIWHGVFLHLLRPFSETEGE